MKPTYSRKTLITIILILISATALFVVFARKDTIIALDVSTGRDEGTSEAFFPAAISIPSLDIEANIIEVGVDKHGNMDVPRDVSEIGWYEPGYRPGENGNAVLAGHVNSRLGLPAVFRNLESLEIGETFTLRDAEGRELTFRVTEKNTYDFRTAPLEKIYGPTDVPTVNLITCDDGLWLGNTYKDRLVITGVLVSGGDDMPDEVL